MRYSHFVSTSLFLFLFSFASFANHYNPKTILDNAEITWAAEVYTYYAPDLDGRTVGKDKMQTLQIEGRNSSLPLKIQNNLSDDDIYGDPSTLAKKLMSLSPSTAIYADSDLKTKFSHGEYKKLLSSVDTIITFNPKTFEEVVQVMVSAIRHDNVQSFKVKQVLYYNAKTHQLNATPIAIAPMLCSKDKKGNVTNLTPLFWIPISSITAAADLDNPQINYAIRISRELDGADMKIIKGEGTIGDIFKDIVENAQLNSEKSKIYHTFGQMHPMTAEEMKHLGSSIDTIITFDPNTFQEIVQVVESSNLGHDIKKIRLVQNWIWNQEEQKLQIRLVAFAPIISRFDNAGNFLNSGPMFYKKPNEF